MKKFVFGLLLVLLMPMVALATEVDIVSADMTIDLPDDWYVFTRENIENNSKLEELGLTYDFMEDLMYGNDMYLDAISDEEEFVISVLAVSGVGNLNDYFDSEVEDLAKEIQEDIGLAEYELYNNDYKYVYLEYMDAGYYIINYYTIIADRAYTFTFQKETEFTNEEKETYKEIVDSVKFDKYVPLDNNKEIIVVAAGIGLVVVLGIVAVIVAKIKGNESKKESKENV